MYLLRKLQIFNEITTKPDKSNKSTIVGNAD